MRQEGTPPGLDDAVAPPVPEAAGATGHTRSVELDGLRAVAVLLVFVYHVTLAALPLQPHLLPLGLSLDAGVEVFFVLSGFLIYSPFARAHLDGRPAPGLAGYARRRALRIYPGYLVTLAVLTAAGWIALGGPLRTLAHLTLTQGYQDDGPLVNPGLEPAWTLCVEVTFYAFVPLWAALVRAATRRLGAGALRTEVAGAGLLLAVGVATLGWQAHGGLPIPLGVLLPHLTTLAAGMLLAIVAAGRRTRPRLDAWARRTPAALLTWPLAVLALRYMPGRPDAWPAPAGPLMVAALTQAAFAVLLAAPVMLGTAGAVGRVLRWRPVAWVGVVSYGIYLWHYDLLLDLAPDLWAGGRLRAAAGVALVLAVSMVAGALSYALLERPALALARRDRRPAPAATAPAPSPTPAPPATAPAAGAGAGRAVEDALASPHVVGHVRAVHLPADTAGGDVGTAASDQPA